MISQNEPRVIQILQSCIDTYRRKASDYNHPTKHDSDPLSNFKVAAELAVPPYLGALVRLSDKWERIKTLVFKKIKKGEGPAVKDESIKDTLLDMINYSAIVLALIEEEENEAKATS